MTIQHKSYNEKELASKYEDGLNKRPKDDYKRKPKNTKMLHSWFYDDNNEYDYDDFEDYYHKTLNEE
jgi:hypothetical protein